MNESVDAIRQAHDNNLSVEGIIVNGRRDIEMLETVFENPSPLNDFIVKGDDSVVLTPQGPSFQFFYRNLARVTRGEWWFYPDTLSLDNYKKTLPSRDKYATSEANNREEEVHFQILYLARCYDIDGFADMFGTGDHEELHRLLFMRIAALDREKMPAERFLEIYNGPPHAQFNLEAVKRYLRNAKLLLVDLFRNTLHKNSS